MREHYVHMHALFVRVFMNTAKSIMSMCSDLP